MLRIAFERNVKFEAVFDKMSGFYEIAHKITYSQKIVILKCIIIIDQLLLPNTLCDRDTTLESDKHISLAVYSPLETSAAYTEFHNTKCHKNTGKHTRKNSIITRIVSVISMSYWIKMW